MHSEVKEKEEVRQKILTQAQELFMKYGIRSVTMNDIAKELGMSKKTIYKYFNDKNEIVTLVTEQQCARDMADIIRLQEEARDAIDAILKISVHFRKVYENMNPSMIYDMEKYHPNAWKVSEKKRDVAILEQFTGNMRRGIEEGLYRSGINIELLSRMHIKQMELASNEKIFPPDQFDFLDIHLEIVEHFIRGIVTREGFEKLESYQNLSNDNNHED